MNGTAITCSSAKATRYSEHTSSTIAATRRWEARGATSPSRRPAARRLGRTRPRVTPRPRPTSGVTGTTTTTPKPLLIRSGWTYSPTLKEPPCEGRRKRQRRAKREGCYFVAFEQLNFFTQKLRESDFEEPGSVGRPIANLRPSLPSDLGVLR